MIPFALHAPSETAMSIAQRHTDCYSALQELCKSANGSGLYHHDLLEEFDKYCLWAGNVGAGHSGKTYKLSLDYRLREASFYKDQVPYTFFLNVEGTLLSAVGAQAACRNDTTESTLLHKSPYGQEALYHLIKRRYGALKNSIQSFPSRS